MAQEMTTIAGNGAGRLTRHDEGEATRARPIFRPATDIYETEDTIFVVAEMPGVASGDVDVSLERRVLTIYGRAADRPQDAYQPLFAEYGEGDYERSFTISEDVDRDNIKATHQNGVLTLALPKAGAAKPRKIEVSPA